MAEKKLLGRMTAGVDDDLLAAHACAALLGLAGRERERFLDACEERVRAILDADWPRVLTVARLLLRRERRWQWRALDGRELRALVSSAQSGPCPR